MALHARKKFRQFVDARRERDWGAVKLESSGVFPKIPPARNAPRVLREALARDAENILHGRWHAFRELELRVDDPPHWHKDYLANVDLATNESAFELNHRALPNGADVKLIWELSRWNQLVRLAMAAHVLGDERAAHKCVTWLEDWVKHNPPFCGWNWTSALESGLRLVQFTWMDALLSPYAERWGFDAELETLRHGILPPHVWFTWRHKSFGSSANNHLLGELAGLIVATARWPALADCGAALDELQPLWEREVLAQFAEDGGNKEQALNYQLFAFEFCLHARNALLTANREVFYQVNARLDAAMRFFNDVQVDREPWDYGDSDDAYVTPLFAGPQFTREWLYWIARRNSSALDYWLDSPPLLGRSPNSGPPLCAKELGDWWVYGDSGIALCESGFWWLRWDLSPLGYLATAAHGHLDALHLSLWWKGVAIVVDPGTGAYYGDKPLRQWLASRAAHNGPRPVGDEWPRRLGPFLWAEHHEKPEVKSATRGQTGSVDWNGGRLTRTVEQADHPIGWSVTDSCEGAATDFTVRWQFAPGARFKRIGERRFELHRGDAIVGIEVSDDWAEVFLVETKGDEAEQRLLTSSPAAPLEQEFAGTVSPSFRRTEWAPYLKLVARPQPGRPCVFRTSFVASGAS